MGEAATSTVRSRIRRFWGPTANQSALAVVDQGLVSAANFITAVLVGRSAGLDELGAYSLGFTLLILTAAFHEALIAIPYSVYLSRLDDDKKRTLGGSALVHVAGLAMLTSVVLVVTAVALGLGGATRTIVSVVWVLVAIAPLAMLREFARRHSFAELRVRSAVLVDAAATFLQLAGLVALTEVDRVSAQNVLAVAGVAAGVPALFWLRSMRGAFDISRADVRSTLRRHWAFGRWVVAARVTSITHSYVVPWMLAALIDIAATGGYSAAATIVAVTNPLLIGAGMVLTPRAARAFAQGGSAELRRVVEKASAALTLVAVGIALPLLLFGPQLLRVVFGEDAAGFGSTVRLLALALIVSVLGMGAEAGLRATERPRVSFVSSVAGLTVTASVALVAIPAWDAAGGAFGVLIGGGVSTAIKCVRFFRADEQQDAGHSSDPKDQIGASVAG